MTVEEKAEEWVKENMDCCKTDNSVNQSIPYFDEEERCCAKSAYQDGAEYGYNKAKEEMQEQGLALQSDMDKTIEQNIALKKELEKANEWHYVKDELPISDKDKYYFVIDKWNEPMIARFYEGVWSNYSTIEDVIAWKEIVLPKEIKEND